jgi:hypothetical protein
MSVNVQRLHVATLRRRPAMCHQVCLHEPGRRIVPVAEGANHHAAPDRRRGRRATTRPSSRSASRFPQCPIHRRRTHRQQTRQHLWRQLKMAVPLHCRDQDRHQRTQPLAADPVRRLPNHNQRLARRLVIKPALRAQIRVSARHAGPQQARRVLAVVARQRRELVQHPAPIRPATQGVSPRQCHHQLVACRHADQPHVRPHRPTPVGSKLREATGQPRGAFQARQCE